MATKTLHIAKRHDAMLVLGRLHTSTAATSHTMAVQTVTVIDQSDENDQPKRFTKAIGVANGAKSKNGKPCGDTPQAMAITTAVTNQMPIAAITRILLGLIMPNIVMDAALCSLSFFIK